MFFVLKVLGYCDRGSLLNRQECLERLREGCVVERLRQREGRKGIVGRLDFSSIFNSHDLLAWFKIFFPLSNSRIVILFCWGIRPSGRWIDAPSFT